MSIQDKTNTGKPRQKRAEITRQKICEAAIMLLGAGGAKAVTHRTVAEHAGVSLAATTYHFEDKAELLTAAFEWLIDLYIEQARNKLEEALKADITLEGLTEHIITVSRQGMMAPSQRVFVCAWYEFMLEACRNPDLQPTVDKWYSDTCRHYQEILERYGSRSPVDDTRRLVDFLIGYEFVAMATRLRKLRNHDITEIYGRLVESMFDGEQKKRQGKRPGRARAKTRTGNT